jgi:hypothetical protein
VVACTGGRYIQVVAKAGLTVLTFIVIAQYVTCQVNKLMYVYILYLMILL